jgi:hypothetical protein
MIANSSLPLAPESIIYLNYYFYLYVIYIYFNMHDQWTARTDRTVGHPSPAFDMSQSPPILCGMPANTCPAGTSREKEACT